MPIRTRCASPSTPRTPIISSARRKASWPWRKPRAISRWRPKSNAVYAAWNQVKDDIRDKPAEPVPLHIRNAPTGLMANLGYGRDYQYAHDAPEALVSQEHLPDALRGRVYYRPTDRGAEKELAERLRGLAAVARRAPAAPRSRDARRAERAGPRRSGTLVQRRSWLTSDCAWAWCSADDRVSTRSPSRAPRR